MSKGKSKGHPDPAFKPDLGLKLLATGCRQASFAEFTMWTLSRIGPVAYSVTNDMHYDGAVHAVTVDFEDDAFLALLEAMPPAIVVALADHIQQPFTAPQMFNLPVPVTVRLTCELGERCANADEEYVPLRAVSVLKG